MAKIHDNTPLDELAAQYVLMVNTEHPDVLTFEEASSLYERIRSRVDAKAADILIDRSKEIYRILVSE